MIFDGFLMIIYVIMLRSMKTTLPPPPQELTKHFTNVSSKTKRLGKTFLSNR